MIVFAIVVLAGIVGLYAVAIKRVWQGTSEYDASDPPAWWPFSLPLWRGSARAMPVLGVSGLILIGAGIVSDLVGEGSRYYDLVMTIGVLGLLGTILVGFPIMYFSRPRALIPPSWRDDPSTVEEWRAKRARR